MFPHEHLLVALIPVVAYIAIRDRRLPARAVAFAAIVGSQFPDLVDKPLAHQFGLLPSGRVFLHSLPLALPITACVLAYGYTTERPRVAGAFAVAYLSHLVGDTYQPLLAGDVPADLLWPFTAAQPRPRIPFWAGADGINLRLWTLFSVVVLGVTVVMLLRDIRDQICGRM